MTTGQKGQEEFDENSGETTVPQKLAGWWPFDKKKSQDSRVTRGLHRKANNIGQENGYQRSQNLQHICFVDLAWGKSEK